MYWMIAPGPACSYSIGNAAGLTLLHRSYEDPVVLNTQGYELWVGQTDEEELGYTYDEMDRLLYALVEEQLSPEECLEEGFSEDFVESIRNRVKRYRFKSTLPLAGSVGQFPLTDLEQLSLFQD